MGRTTSADGRERIAVVGGGAAGLGAAWRLSEKYDVTVYEKESELGGHAASVPFKNTGKRVDLGVMITLPWAYPNLHCMFERYHVRTRAAAASLLVSFAPPGEAEQTWSTDSQQSALFASFSLEASRFEALMFEIAALPLEQQLAPISFYLDGRVDGVPHSGGFSAAFRSRALAPLLSLFLVTRRSLLDTPAFSLSMMFRYGTLSFFSPTTWRTIVGSTHDYVARLTRSFRARFLLSTEVVRVERRSDRVVVHDAAEPEPSKAEHYAHVVMATGADVAKRLLQDLDPAEEDVLGAFRYEDAYVFLHQDRSVLSPAFDANKFFQYRSLASAPTAELDGVMTYDMTRAAGLTSEEGPALVSVHSTPDAPPDQVLAQRKFSHVIADGTAVQKRLAFNTIQGRRRTWFAGDYVAFSSHEDAFSSGMVIAEALGVPYPFRRHAPAHDRYRQNRLMMLPPLGVRTRLDLQARGELLVDSAKVLLPAARERLATWRGPTTEEPSFP